MTPKSIFTKAWNRALTLRDVHVYLATYTTQVIDKDELLRAEWAMYVSALDLYVHEITAQNMLETFRGNKQASIGYKRHNLSLELLGRIRSATTQIEAEAAFELDIREKMAFQSFQDPEKIADAIRLISDIELWNSIAEFLAQTGQNTKQLSKDLKTKLSLIVRRRNKIVHEGDLQPALPREPWPISRQDTDDVKDFIFTIVQTIDTLIN